MVEQSLRKRLVLGSNPNSHRVVGFEYARIGPVVRGITTGSAMAQAMRVGLGTPFYVP